MLLNKFLRLSSVPYFPYHTSVIKVYITPISYRIKYVNGILRE